MSMFTVDFVLDTARNGLEREEEKERKMEERGELNVRGSN